MQHPEGRTNREAGFSPPLDEAAPMAGAPEPSARRATNAISQD